MIKQQEVHRQHQKSVKKTNSLNFSIEFKSNLGKTSTNTGATSIRSKHLQPILVENKGYYQLGPDISSAEIFSLSITIRSAKNLVHVRKKQI
jgi:hypothetical protein